MAVTININGELVLDQTAGLQVENDDVEVTSVGGVLGGSLDTQFLTYLNGLNLTAAQTDFAASVEGASQPGMVTVDITNNEIITKLIFSNATGGDFEGVLVPDVTTINGDPLYLWSAQNGKVVLVSTSAVAPTASTIAAAFYIESTDATNVEAKVESITFIAMMHPDETNHDDPVDFSDILRVAAVVTITTPIGDDVIVEDDGPSIVVSGIVPEITVDETDLGDDNSADFTDNFTKNFGTDGPGEVSYVLGISAENVDSGIDDMASGDNILLRTTLGGDIEGYLENDDTIVAFVISNVDAVVTLDQQRAVVHPDQNDPDDSKGFAAADMVTLTGTITDADDDSDDDVLNLGDKLFFKDDGPSIETTGDAPTATVDETLLNVGASADFAPNFSELYGADGEGTLEFDLDVQAGVLAGVTDTLTGENINLSKNGDVIEARTAIGNVLVFSISVDAFGEVDFLQARSVTHADADDPDDIRMLGNVVDLVTLTGTVTDKDGDEAEATLDITQSFRIKDDGPTVTAPFDGDPGTAGVQQEKLGNAVGQTATGVIGFDIGEDDRLAYPAGTSDFVDTNAVLAGVQIALTGTVENAQNPNITDAVATLQSESALQATFNWSFTYDKDPITAGVQSATAAGTLVFDKVNDTYSMSVTDAIDGFSFSVLHTNELLAKAPPGNSGHPELVVTELDQDLAGPDTGFYVQFTANSLNQANQTFGFNATGDGPAPGDTAFNAGQFISNNHEDWVSATQTTNGVAGDTIQKGELLTLRFFGENILGDVNPNAPGGGTEKVSPTTTADGIAIKFDGIGNSEDLVMILDLIDYGANGVLGGGDDIETTRAVNVQNSDMIKGVVPSPYNTEFSLDNNDALVILEKNDYNDGTENFQIQGVQIMQSANGLTGLAINLNGTIDNINTVPIEGDSAATSGLTAWDVTDNDVLKIVDIGFIQSTQGTIDADLDFSFQVYDADGDVTPPVPLVIDVSISNDWIV